MPSKKKSSPSLETAMEQLSSLVEEMETQELPLETAMEHFEKGMLLVNQCQQTLKNAELNIQKIIEKNNQPATKPLNLSDTDG